MRGSRYPSLASSRGSGGEGFSFLKSKLYLGSFGELCDLAMQIAKECYLFVQTAHIRVVWSAPFGEEDGGFERDTLLGARFQSSCRSGQFVTLGKPFFSLLFRASQITKFRFGFCDLLQLPDGDVQLEDDSRFVTQE